MVNKLLTTLALFLALGVSAQAQALCKKDTACNLIFLLVDAANNETAEPSLADLTAQISKNTGAFANADNCTNGGTECASTMGNGWYFFALTTTESNTEGPMALRVTGAGGEANEYRGVVLITDSLWSATAAANFEAMFDGTGYAGGTIRLKVIKSTRLGS